MGIFLSLTHLRSQRIISFKPSTLSCLLSLARDDCTFKEADWTNPHQEKSKGETSVFQTFSIGALITEDSWTWVATGTNCAIFWETEGDRGFGFVTGGEEDGERDVCPASLWSNHPEE